MDDPIAEFESDKATFEVNAEKAGLITELRGEEGDTIEVNTIIAVIDETAKAPEKPKSEAKPTADSKTDKPTETPNPKKESVAANPVVSEIDVDASPLAKELIQEHGISPSDITGTGSNGRITKIDVLEALVKNGVFKNASTTAGFGNKASREPRREKMSNLRKTVAKRLVSAK
jgi:2-oxoglutarate dehydrogenase E2 component (dihydrolipoamide succinyltransferase)